MDKIEKQLNIYQKIQALRVELQECNIKKSGKNKFQGFSYYELQDFLPLIISGCKKMGLYTHIDFKPDIAILTITNANTPEEKEVFESPSSEMDVELLKNKSGKQSMHPIQALGAVQTYLRRYLYMNAFEIVECDNIDSQEPVTSAPAAKVQTPTVPAGDIPACAKCGKKMYKSKYDDSYYCSDFKVCKQKWWPPKSEAKPAAVAQSNDEPPSYVDEDIPF